MTSSHIHSGNIKGNSMWLVQNPKAISWIPGPEGWRNSQPIQFQPWGADPLHRQVIYFYSWNVHWCSLSELELAGHVIFSVWIGWGKWKQTAASWQLETGRQQRKAEELSGDRGEVIWLLWAFLSFSSVISLLFAGLIFLNKLRMRIIKMNRLEKVI